MNNKYFILPVLLMAGCSASPEMPEEPELDEGPVLQTDVQSFSPPEPQEQAAINERAVAFERTMLIADILYEAEIAFEDNRLMLPIEDNAYNRYQLVLAMEPENSVAQQGLNNIARRYEILARRAMERGQFEETSTLLENATLISPSSEAAAEIYKELEIARQTEIGYFDLDPLALEQQSIEVLVRLSEIGEFIKEKQATFLITGRTDDEARWIYKIMREAVGGYRLRGNIVLGSEPGIQVNIPRI